MYGGFWEDGRNSIVFQFPTLKQQYNAIDSKQVTYPHNLQNTAGQDKAPTAPRSTMILVSV